MNLINAIKSGRPIRRQIPKHLGSSGDGWLSPDCVLRLLIVGEQRVCEGGRLIEESDFFADDWEVKEPEVLITRKQFWEAVRETLKDVELRSVWPGIYFSESPLEALAAQLGLGKTERK